jgi:uncharacterized membrane protein
MPDWTDQRMEIAMAKLLRGGVLLAAAVVLAGGILFLVRHGSEPVSYAKFRGADAEYRSAAAVLAAVGRGDPRALIQLGLVLLIATPVARVAFSLVGFVMERDRVYVALTAIVLIVLGYSLLLGR